MEYHEIRYEKTDGVAVITLNRPEVLNAYTHRMLDEWVHAAEDAGNDDEVRVLVVTGAGRGFCAGADTTEVLKAQVEPIERRRHLQKTVHRVARALVTLEKPYIAAVNGPAAGMGMDVASWADVRFASETATFTMSYVKLGLVPGAGGCYFLPRIVGKAKALDLMWTGRTMSAAEALAIGYVTRVVPPAQLMTETLGYARILAEGPPIAIQLIKRMVNEQLGEEGITRALHQVEQSLFIARTSEDAKEGAHALGQRRKPIFQGR